MEAKILVGILVLLGIIQGTKKAKKRDRPPEWAFFSAQKMASRSSVEKFVRSKKPPLSEQEIQLLVDSLMEAARKEKLDPALLAALIYRESGFNPKAISSSGAKGLGQLLDSTARELGVEDPFDIQQNVMGTAKYLARQIRRFPGDAQAIEKGLACYRIGCRLILESGAIPAIPEVQAFISDIRRYQQAIHEL